MKIGFMQDVNNKLSKKIAFIHLKPYIPVQPF
jgi:hypothetical protein